MPDSIRDQYVRYGAQGYYEQFGAQYRNPHELQCAKPFTPL